MATADITNGTGVEDLREYLLHGGGNVDTYTAFLKGLQGDYVFSLSATTAAPTVAELTAAAQSYTITITLKTNNGETHSWYNGPIKLAIADNDGTGAATIAPTSTTPVMTNGVYTVVVTMSKAVWTAENTATLTVSDPDTTGIGGWIADDATFVATVAA